MLFSPGVTYHIHVVYNLYVLKSSCILHSSKLWKCYFFLMQIMLMLFWWNFELLFIFKVSFLLIIKSCWYWNSQTSFHSLLQIFMYVHSCENLQYPCEKSKLTDRNYIWNTSSCIHYLKFISLLELKYKWAFLIINLLCLNFLH